MDHADDEVLLDERMSRVILVLEAFYAERARASTGDAPPVGRVSRRRRDLRAAACDYRRMADRGDQLWRDRPGRSRDDFSAPGQPSASHRPCALHQAQRALGQWVIRTAAAEAVESWEEIRDERNGLQYAVASWLTLALSAYLTALEAGAEVEPMEIAKWLIRALAWTAGELAVAEEQPQPLLG